MVHNACLLLLVIGIVSVLLVGAVTVNFRFVLGSTANSNNSLYVAGFERAVVWREVSQGITWKTVAEGNITLVNPTDKAFNNLNMTIKVDGSDLTWYSNYSTSWASNPNQFMGMFNQTANVSFSPEELISIEPNQTKTVTVFFPDFDSYFDPFQFSSHTIQFFVSQNRFGDIINGQTLTVPQTMAYLKIVSYSQIEADDTYGYYYNATLNETMATLEHPNFYQRYVNFSIPDFPAVNYQLMDLMGRLCNTYFNVTVVNNSTFPVTNVSLFGSPSQYPNGVCGGAKTNLVMQPNDTLLFPIGVSTIPSNGYVTGYITNASSDIPNLQPVLTSTPVVPEFPTLIILPLLVVATLLSIVLIRRISKK
jgi:type II secretory pathway pseudopilin PulG